jgi:hypothetical protein
VERMGDCDVPNPRRRPLPSEIAGACLGLICSAPPSHLQPIVAMVTYCAAHSSPTPTRSTFQSPPSSQDLTRDPAPVRAHLRSIVHPYAICKNNRPTLLQRSRGIASAISASSIGPVKTNRADDKDQRGACARNAPV